MKYENDHWVDEMGEPYVDKPEQALVFGGCVIGLIVLLASAALFDAPQKLAEWIVKIL